jgi:hypothetical protein
VASEQRVGQSEAVFRSVNERAVALDRRLGEPLGEEVLCECARDDCTERIVVASDVYEAVRAHARRFLVVPGHEESAVEHVLTRTPGYLIVEKTGRAGQVADETDPRGADATVGD